MEGSREFLIGTREFIFEENEAIFFMQSALPVQQHVNMQEGCNTCGSKWEKASELANSHCDFCGISNCKQCLSKTRKFRQDPKASMLPNVGPVRGKCCKLCDRKFHIKAMVADSGNQIKVQNLTIENALRQTKKWSADIVDGAEANRKKTRNEQDKDKILGEEIAKLEDEISKLKQDQEDLTQEINFSTQREKMFKQQVVELETSYVDIENKLRDTVIENKQMEEQLRQAISNGQSMRDEYKQRTRMGRQPSLSGESKEAKKKREDRVSGKSFEGFSSSDNISDTSSFMDPRNVMQVPELEDANEPHFGQQN